MRALAAALGASMLSFGLACGGLLAQDHGPAAIAMYGTWYPVPDLADAEKQRVFELYWLAKGHKDDPQRPSAEALLAQGLTPDEIVLTSLILDALQGKPEAPPEIKALVEGMKTLEGLTLVLDAENMTMNVPGVVEVVPFNVTEQDDSMVKIFTWEGDWVLTLEDPEHLSVTFPSGSTKAYMRADAPAD